MGIAFYLELSCQKILTALFFCFKIEQFAISAATNFSQLLLTVTSLQSGGTHLSSDQARGHNKDNKAMPTNTMQTNTFYQWKSPK